MDSVVPSVQASPLPLPLPSLPESPLSSPQAASDASMTPVLTAARIRLVRFTLLPLQVGDVGRRARARSLRQPNSGSGGWPCLPAAQKVAKWQRFSADQARYPSISSDQTWS